MEPGLLGGVREGCALAERSRNGAARVYITMASGEKRKDFQTAEKEYQSAELARISSVCIDFGCFLSKRGRFREVTRHSNAPKRLPDTPKLFSRGQQYTAKRNQTVARGLPKIFKSSLTPNRSSPARARASLKRSSAADNPILFLPKLSGSVSRTGAPTNTNDFSLPLGW